MIAKPLGAHTNTQSPGEAVRGDWIPQRYERCPIHATQKGLFVSSLWLQVTHSRKRNRKMRRRKTHNPLQRRLASVSSNLATKLSDIPAQEESSLKDGREGVSLSHTESQRGKGSETNILA